MAGRIARGEVWQFAELASETSLRVDGCLRFLDRFYLDPRKQSPVTQWTMRDAHYLATALCYDPRASEITDRVHELLPEAGIDTPAPGLLALRVAASNGSDFHKTRDAFTSQIDSLSEQQRFPDLKP
jgi:urease accessory protein UreH